MNSFAANIKSYIENEISAAEDCLSLKDDPQAFRHLERAHILGQSITFQHTRVHYLMLKIGWRRRDIREIFGQLFRIAGAATKTPFGIYPSGNTGGANVYFFKPMPLPDDLKQIMSQAQSH